MKRRTGTIGLVACAFALALAGCSSPSPPAGRSTSTTRPAAEAAPGSLIPPRLSAVYGPGGARFRAAFPSAPKRGAANATGLSNAPGSSAATDYWSGTSDNPADVSANPKVLSDEVQVFTFASDAAAASFMGEAKLSPSPAFSPVSHVPGDTSATGLAYSGTAPGSGGKGYVTVELVLLGSRVLEVTSFDPHSLAPTKAFVASFTLVPSDGGGAS